MSKEVSFEEILNDGILPGPYEPVRFRNPFMNDYAAKLIEVHTTPPGIIEALKTCVVNRSSG